MQITNSLTDDIFGIKSSHDFERVCMQVFKYQALHCKVYADFLNFLGKSIDSVSSPTDIPFLPIEFFKSHEVIANEKQAQLLFTSSSTTGSTPSRHYVADVSIYEKSYLKSFELFYGSPTGYAILALLPSYQQREGSSLIYMVNDLIRRSNHPDSGFFLNEDEKLFSTLKQLNESGKKNILIGVSYALLDFAEKYQYPLSHTIIMETGGMKGKRKEIVKEELHKILMNSFETTAIQSEYSMTELLSQAYSYGNGNYECPPWMKVLIRDINEPIRLLEENKTGGINIIDLANVYSCSFIATQDLGRLNNDGTFSVLGRFDNSDIRGCNLMVE